MSRRRLVGGIFAASSSLAVLLTALHFVGPRELEGAQGPLGFQGDPGLGSQAFDLLPGWSIRSLTRLGDSVNSLAVSPRRNGDVYIGTTGVGAVYRMNVMAPETVLTVSTGLGDVARFGDCWVNRLAIRDLDGDGFPELIASTSQVTPRGRPRLYIWSLATSVPVLEAMARPEIQSSWSHGLGFLPRGDSGAESLFLTFCGNGEIVEYDYKPATSPSGFQGAALAWKQVGQLPASGEWSQAADVDNDGRIDLCLAAGYAEHKAAIHAYNSPSRGADLILTHEINEQGRFANVKFLVGDLRGDGTSDLVAWWCTDHVYGGRCEVIRYHLGHEGVHSREVIANGKSDLFWPSDGQTALLDMDADGRPEVWFAASSGNLWRYDPTQPTALARVLKTSSLGPIAGGLIPNSSRPTLILGQGCDLLRLDCMVPQSAPTHDRSHDAAPTVEEPIGEMAVE